MRAEADSSGVSEGRPPGFNALWRGYVYRLATESPLFFRRIPMGSKAFSVAVVYLLHAVNVMVGLQLLNTMVGPQIQLSVSMADSPTFCLHGPMSTFQLTLFQNLQILRTIASGHDVIHTPAIFPIWGLLWHFIPNLPFGYFLFSNLCYRII